MRLLGPLQSEASLVQVIADTAAITFETVSRSRIEAVAARLYDEGVVRVVRSVWYSSPAKAIVEAARVRRVNVIVMSPRGRRGLGRLLGGSVADAVVRATRTPIMLVPAAEAA